MKRSQPEHIMQCSVIRRVHEMAEQDPLWKLIYAVPNGGQRNKITAAKLKREGVKAGVPDLCWPLARHGYHGLYLELKCGDNDCTDSQKEYQQMLAEQGYLVGVVWDDPQAVMLYLQWYHQGEKSP